MFARFSRPRARLIFARHPVILPHDGVDTLMVRVVNARESFITEATAKMWMLGPIGDRRRAALRRLPADAAAASSENPAFALSWTLFHPIDARFAAARLSQADRVADEVNFVVSIAGLDETLLADRARAASLRC